MVDFPIAKGWFVAANTKKRGKIRASCPVYAYDGSHLSVTNFQRKIICQGCEGKNSEAEAYFHSQFVSAVKQFQKKESFRLKKFRMEMSNNFYQAQDLRLQ